MTVVLPGGIGSLFAPSNYSMSGLTDLLIAPATGFGTVRPALVGATGPTNVSITPFSSSLTVGTAAILNYAGTAYIGSESVTSAHAYQFTIYGMGDGVTFGATWTFLVHVGTQTFPWHVNYCTQPTFNPAAVYGSPYSISYSATLGYYTFDSNLAGTMSISESNPNPVGTYSYIGNSTQGTTTSGVANGSLAINPGDTFYFEVYCPYGSSNTITFSINGYSTSITVSYPS